MATCPVCDRNMSLADRCTREEIVFPDCTRLPVVPWSGPGRCPDCGVRAGAAHHFGCDLERCPRCKRQLIGCACDSALPTLH